MLDIRSPGILATALGQCLHAFHNALVGGGNLCNYCLVLGAWWAHGCYNTYRSALLFVWMSKSNRAAKAYIVEGFVSATRHIATLCALVDEEIDWIWGNVNSYKYHGLG